MHIGELQEMMGNLTTETEAKRMAEILAARGITTIEQVERMNDAEFFALIPEALSTETR